MAMIKHIRAGVAMAAIGLLAVQPAFGQVSTEAPVTTPLELNQPIPGAKMTVERIAVGSPAMVPADKPPVGEILEFRVSSKEAIPVRAIDPVLYVGGTKITDYRYEDEGRTLVFSLADPQKAQEGATSYIQFGNQTSTKTPLGKFVRKQTKEVQR